MTISLSSVIPRSARRLRLVFSQTLAAGAFGVSPTFYTVSNLDGRGISPTVQAALAVVGSPAVVELALGSDLVHDAQYSVAAVAVPAADLSVTPGGTLERFKFAPGLVAGENTEPKLRDRDLLLYGTDLIWDGADFLESATGDLERVRGRANVTKALHHGLSTHGLPWDPNWGVDAREFVDSPSPSSGSLKGAAVAQVLRDPRVRTVSSQVQVNYSDTYLYLTPKLVSGETIQPVSITVPHDS